MLLLADWSPFYFVGAPIPDLLIGWCIGPVCSPGRDDPVDWNNGFEPCQVAAWTSFFRRFAVDSYYSVFLNEKLLIVGSSSYVFVLFNMRGACVEVGRVQIQLVVKDVFNDMITKARAGQASFESIV